MTQEYPWYEVVEKSEELEQGDFIDNCQIVIPTYFSADTQEDYAPTSTHTYKTSGIEQIHNVVIVSQSCDLENRGKIEYVLLCPRIGYAEFARVLSQNMSAKAVQNSLEQIKQGKQHRYCMLNKSDVTIQEYYQGCAGREKPVE